MQGLQADKSKRKAAAWEFFEEVKDKGKTICNLCSVELTYAAGSTSSMRKHLDLKHPSLSKDKLSKGKALVRPVTDMFHCPFQGEKYERITKAAILMCAEDLRPLFIVNVAGFRTFCKELNPMYSLKNPNNAAHLSLEISY